MQKLTRALIVAALALTALPSCGSELGNCGLIMVATLPQDSATISVGDSLAIAAQVVSACPDKIGAAVDFSSSDTRIVSVRSSTDTGAWAKGLAPGIAFVSAVGRDRSSVRASVRVTVTSP